MARPSRHESVYIRKVRATVKKVKQQYDVQAIQSQRGQTVTRGGDPQTDWMRWRQPKTAIMEMLSLEARKRLTAANVKLNIVGPTDQAQYSPFSIPFTDTAKTITIRSGMAADDIRHELTHAGLDVASNLFSNVAPMNVFANTALGTFMGQMNLGWNAAAQMEAAESPAITMGGASAYPGFTPSNAPEDFSRFFDVTQASWQYSNRPGWNIGK